MTRMRSNVRKTNYVMNTTRPERELKGSSSDWAPEAIQQVPPFSAVRSPSFCWPAFAAVRLAVGQPDGAAAPLAPHPAAGAALVVALRGGALAPHAAAPLRPSGGRKATAGISGSAAAARRPGAPLAWQQQEKLVAIVIIIGSAVVVAVALRVAVEVLRPLDAAGEAHGFVVDVVTQTG